MTGCDNASTKSSRTPGRTCRRATCSSGSASITPSTRKPDCGQDSGKSYRQQHLLRRMSPFDRVRTRRNRHGGWRYGPRLALISGLVVLHLSCTIAGANRHRTCLRILSGQCTKDRSLRKQRRETGHGAHFRCPHWPTGLFAGRTAPSVALCRSGRVRLAVGLGSLLGGSAH